MPTTYEQASSFFSVRAIGNRTDTGASPVDDLSAEEDRLAHEHFSEGVVNGEGSFKVTASSGMDLIVGSGGSHTNTALVAGTVPGQAKYMVRLNSNEILSLNASDPSNPRYDEIYLIVNDQGYDSSGEALPRLAVRQGDPAASPSYPGPDPGWKAYLRLAWVTVGAGVSTITTPDIFDYRIFSGLELEGQLRLGTDSGRDTIITAPDATNIKLEIGDNFGFGTEIMSIGTGGITTSVDINGVDPAAHGDNHDPNTGSDPLATAAPQTVVPDVGNTEGSADSYSRSDHRHQILAAAPLDISADAVNWEGDANSFARSNHQHDVDGVFLTELMTQGVANYSPDAGTGLTLTSSYQNVCNLTVTKPAAWTTMNILVWTYSAAHLLSGNTTVDFRFWWAGNTGQSWEANVGGTYPTEQNVNFMELILGRNVTTAIRLEARDQQNDGAILDRAQVMYWAYKAS